MKLYLKFLGVHLRSQMQYKTSFFLTLLGQFLAFFTTLLGVWFMFLRFHEVEGFTFSQVLLCYGTVMMAYSLAECFGRGFDMFPRMIGNGQFDRILCRPRGIVFQVLASQVEFTRFGRVLQAILIFCYALPSSGVSWSPLKVMTLILMVLCGMVMFFCLFLLYAAISFFTIEGLEFMNIFTNGGNEFGRYPYAVYGKTVLFILTAFIPLALFQYYPLLYLLGMKSDLFHMLSPLCCLWFIIPAYGLWRFGLRRYKSTGS